MHLQLVYNTNTVLKSNELNLYEYLYLNAIQTILKLLPLEIIAALEVSPPVSQHLGKCISLVAGQGGARRIERKPTQPSKSVINTELPAFIIKLVSPVIEIIQRKGVPLFVSS